jgi:enamine deaminase RidA (YjgF/YER057c/UK114 family)
MTSKPAVLGAFLRSSSSLMMVLALLRPSPAEGQQGPRFINPASLVKPNGYTHVVVAPDGRTVYIAGQVAFDSTGQLIGGQDFRAQAEQVYRNLQHALASVGGGLDDVVKTTTYVTDLKNVATLREVRTRHLDPAHPPANTLLVVSSLARPDLLLEIEAVAILRQAVRFTGAD